MDERVASGLWRLNPAERYGLRLTLLATALALVGIPFGVLTEQVIRRGRLTHWDTSIAEHLHNVVRGHPLAVDALQALSFLGKPIFLLFAVGGPVIWLWFRHSRRLAVFLVVTSVTGSLVDSAVKLVVRRPRPTFKDPIAHAFGKSFPSGHTMSSTICYGALLLVFLPVASRRWRPVAVGFVVTLVAAIGTSRLALGVHYFTDVLGGAVLGVAWLTASTAAFETWRVERGRPRTKPLKEGVEPEEAERLLEDSA